MAVDIWLSDPRQNPPDNLLEGKPIAYLDNGGYYWFLHPFLEKLAAQTGQYIDLYGDASFCGEALDALSDTIAEARQVIREQPVSWQIHVGTELEPVKKELYSLVQRQEFLNWLDQLEHIVAQAAELGYCVECIGD